MFSLWRLETWNQRAWICLSSLNSTQYSTTWTRSNRLWFQHKKKKGNCCLSIAGCVSTFVRNLHCRSYLRGPLNCDDWRAPPPIPDGKSTTVHGVFRRCPVSKCFTCGFWQSSDAGTCNWSGKFWHGVFLSVEAPFLGIHCVYMSIMQLICVIIIPKDVPSNITLTKLKDPRSEGIRGDANSRFWDSNGM